VLAAGLNEDAALAAEALVLPAEAVLAEEVAARQGLIDPESIHTVRVSLRRHLAVSLRPDFEAIWQALVPTAAYTLDGQQVGRRSLRNQCLAYLAEIQDDYLQTSVLPKLISQLNHADNMTDVMAALATLANLDVPERQPALDAFYARWQHEALVVDKWLQVQATARLPDTTARVRELMQHPAFDLKNPNKVYALLRAFCSGNLRHFHALNGSGYQLAADAIIDLQAMNPQVAARLARSFDRWRQFDGIRQGHVRNALQRVQACDHLAKDVAEVVSHALQ
jgi:aminopeptidase N